MKKKVLAVLMTACMAAGLFAGCGSSEQSDSGSSGSDGSATAEATEEASEEASEESSEGEASAEFTPSAPEASTPEDFKMGAVLVGDENEGYTYAHIEGIQNALKALGLSDSNVIWKYSIAEDESCYDACVDCIQQGATLVITNSYGHQSFAQQVAEEYPDVQVVAMTGDTARAAGLPNFHNAFTKIYEARYLGGIVAGMKIAELEKDGKLKDANYDSDGNVKVGYVGAYPYAEVVSGYTAFYLGIKSVYEKVSMEVQYTNSWFNITAENEAALALINDGCVIIGQHADSTGAPSACEEKLKAGTTVYSVGYNVDMLSVAPDAALTSPTNNWGVYYEYCIGSCLNGKAFDTNWAQGLESDAVALSPLGTSCAEGTQEAVDKAIEEIKADKLHVFDTSTFTVDGKEVTSAFATDTDGDFTPDADEAIFDGYYHESYFQSAPSFQLRIDGIKELN